MSYLYAEDENNLLFKPIEAYIDAGKSIRFINDELSSINFDGIIPAVTASIQVSDVNGGYHLGVYDNDISDYIYYPIVRVEREDPDGPTYTGYHEIFYLQDKSIQSASFSSSADVVVIIKEDWDQKYIGTSGWLITQQGNAIFSNVAVRGDLEATTLDVGGANGITYDGSTVTIGTNVNILGTTTTDKLQVGASPNILKISASPNGVPGQDGIYINEYNYWYTDGQFGVGGSAGSAKWTGSALSITGNINATSGQFTGSVSAQTITASNGNIGGFTLASNQLSASQITLSSSGGLRLGASNEFSVDQSGNLVATTASISGNINATSGSFSGDITAAAGRFTGSVSVNTNGIIYAGTAPDSGQRVVMQSTGLFGYGNSGTEVFALPTSGASPRIGRFSIIDTGIVSQSASNANMIIGDVDSSGSVNNGIVIAGYRGGTSSPAIYTVLSGVATTATTGSGFYVDELGRFRLAGSNGSLTFDGNNLSITGSVTANAGTFTGSVSAQHISASTGSIGGFGLSASSLTASAGPASAVGITTGASAIFAGATSTDGSGAKFLVLTDGSMFSTAASISGSIIANSGSIGAWQITSSSLVSGGNTNRIGLVPNTSIGEIVIYAGSADPAFAPFRVTNSGSFFATTASISGRISAASGTIGGFTLSDTSLTASTSTASTAVGLSTTASAFFAGALSPTGSTGAAFWVSRTGSVFAQAASISGNINATSGQFTGSVNAQSITASVGIVGGFTLASTSLTAGTSPNIVGMSTTASAFYAGAVNSTGGSAKFIVKSDGSLISDNIKLISPTTTNPAYLTVGELSLYSNIHSNYALAMYPIPTAFSHNGATWSTPSDINSQTILRTQAYKDTGSDVYIENILRGAYLKKNTTEYIPPEIILTSRNYDYGELFLLAAQTSIGRGDFSVNGAALFVEYSNDRVGIGTYTPAQKLDVDGNINLTGNLQVDNTVVITTARGATLNDTLTINTGGADIGGNLNVTGNIQMDNTVIVGTDGGGQFQAATWVGNSSTDQTARVSGNFIGAGGRSIFRRDTSTAGAGGDVLAIHKFNGAVGTLSGSPNRIVQFIMSGSNAGHINVDGAVTATPAFAAPSDYRLKDDIEDFNYSTELIKNVKLRSFKWKNSGVYDVGFIAHELSEVSRDLVEGEKDALDKQGNPEYQSIMYGRMVPYLAGAVKENILDIEKLYAKIEQLEERIIELENKNV